MEPTTPSTLELTTAQSVLDEEEELAYELAVAEEDGTLKVRKRLFACICVLNIAMNFDAGVLPATLSHVEEQFDGSYTEMGILGALVYVGTMIGCPISGHLLTKCKQRRVLLGGVIGNTIGCFWFGLAGPEHTDIGKVRQPPSLTSAALLLTRAPGARAQYNLFAGRFMIGLTQSAILIYSPVWVDEFAPPGKATQWISLLQANVAIGIMLGYVVGGVFTETFGIPTPLSPLFLGRFAPVFRRFSAVVLCCPASWRQDGENGRKMAKNGRNLGEKRARNSGG
jgi:MFS family permease